MEFVLYWFWARQTLYCNGTTSESEREKRTDIAIYACVFPLFKNSTIGKDIMIITDSYLHIFGHAIPVYGLMFIFGFIIAVVTSLHRLKKYRLAKSELVYAGVFAGIGGVVGAKLLSILTSIPLIVAAIRANPGTETFKVILQDGFVFYGGLIGGFLGILLYTKIYKLSAMEYCDIFAPSVALGHVFGRIGCLFSGCCYGMAVNGGFYVLYPSAAQENIANSVRYLNEAGEWITSGVPLDTKLLPVPLIESVLLIFIFFAAEAVFLKTKRAGLATLTYAAFYATARFILEFFRADGERGIALLSTSQWISLAILLAVGIYAYFFEGKRGKVKRRL